MTMTTRKCTIAAIIKVRDAFGAPGDYGYGTRKGDALHNLFDLYNRLIAQSLIENLPEDEEQPLVDRLTKCLADIVDTPLLSINDPIGNYATKMDVHLGSFQPELSERAASLLEEAGL